MLVENDFEVSVPIDTAWAYLVDVERVVPCIPGAELAETVDDHTWNGTMKLKLGPMSLHFAGTVKVEERDEARHTLTMQATGRDKRGKGSGSMRATSTLHPNATGTRVHLAQDITVTGTIAQFGRGVMEDVTRRLLGQFAECLERSMVAASEPAERGGGRHDPIPGSSYSSEPVHGLRLLIQAVKEAFRRRLSRRHATR